MEDRICKNCGAVIEGEDFIELNGEYACSEECALRLDWRKCDNCYEWYKSLDGVYIYYDYHYCSDDCAIEDGWQRCGNCGDWVSEDNGVCATDGTAFCDVGCARAADYDVCDRCGILERTSNMRDDDDRAICDDCYDRYDYHTCEACGAIIDPNEEEWANGDLYCSECYEDIDNHLNGIHNYTYKPYPVFKGDEDPDESTLYMGVELEVDKGNDGRELADLLTEDNEDIYCKHDGSLGDEGVEIVSHPATLRYHMEELGWQDIIKECLSNDFKSHDAGTCGLHVHVNRTFFGENDSEQDLNIAKVILMVNKFWDSHIIPFSRRNVNQLRWANKSDIKVYKDDTEDNIVSKVKNSTEGAGRYVAVNLQNENTIEFRIFRGTLKQTTFFATLQFVDTFCRFAKKVNLNEIDNLKWEDIFAGMNYSELTDYLKERTDFVPDKVGVVYNERPARKASNKPRDEVAVGDRVCIREWDDMANEYGMDDDDTIYVRCIFTSPMRELCGATGVIKRRRDDIIEIDFDNDSFESNPNDFSFSIYMIDVIEEAA